jgi:DNA-binding PadR family transcriptional regulator
MYDSNTSREHRRVHRQHPRRRGPGAVYPTISQLEDEGLVTVTAESGRKLVTLTDDGRAHVAEHGEAWADPFAGYTASAPGGDLRTALEHVHSAARQVARTGTDEQLTAALAILEEARRSLYLLLAEGPGTARD